MSQSHCIKPYKKEVWIPGCYYATYGEFKRDEEETGDQIKDVKNQIKQLCLCTPKDLFPSDENGDTYYNINERIDMLFEDLNELEWKMSRLHMIRTILDDWEYTGKVDIKKNWNRMNVDLYADLRKDFAETIASMDGNPETIKKQQEETRRVNEELRKKLEEKEEA